MNKFDKNILLLLKIFNNRPNFLKKFLIENDAFNKTFKNKIILSNNLSELKDFNIKDMVFLNYNEMDDFFSKLINDDDEDELNKQLFNYINNEEFEKAAKLRDYMIKNSINIKL